MIAPIEQSLDYRGDTVAHAEEILREIDTNQNFGISLEKIQQQLGKAIAKHPVPYVMAAIAMGLTFGLLIKRIGRQ